MNLFRGIVQAQSREPSSGSNQLSDSLSRLRKAVHSGSTVYLLSDFVGFDEQTKPMHSTSDTALAIDTGSRTNKNQYAQQQVEHQQSVQQFFAKHNHLYFKVQSSDNLLDSVVRIIHRQPDLSQLDPEAIG